MKNRSKRVWVLGCGFVGVLAAVLVRVPQDDVGNVPVEAPPVAAEPPGLRAQEPDSLGTQDAQADLEVDERPTPAPTTEPIYGDGYPEHVVRYLTSPGRTLYLRSHVEERLSVGDLPALYRALEDDAAARDWKDALFALCVLEEDAKAFQVVQDFVATPWEWQKSSYNAHDAMTIILDRILAISSLAMIDPALSGPFLQKTCTLAGAEALLEKWRAAPPPEEERYVESLTHALIHGSARGLLHTRSPELFNVVEDRFEELVALPASERTHLDNVVLEYSIGFLRERDMYREMGWEDGIRYRNGLSTEAYLEMKWQPNRYSALLLKNLGYAPG